MVPDSIIQKLTGKQTRRHHKATQRVFKLKVSRLTRRVSNSQAIDIAQSSLKPVKTSSMLEPYM